MCQNNRLQFQLNDDFSLYTFWQYPDVTILRTRNNGSIESRLIAWNDKAIAGIVKTGKVWALRTYLGAISTDETFPTLHDAEIAGLHYATVYCETLIDQATPE